EKLRDLQNGTTAFGEANRLRVGEFLDRWLAIVATKVQPASHASYEGQVKRHIVPYLGGTKLASLTPLHVEEFYATLWAAGVSAGYQRKIGPTLTVASDHAVAKGLIPSNPAIYVKKPLAEKTEMTVLDPVQVTAFLKAAKEDRLYALYVMALDTGMRPGE